MCVPAWKQPVDPEIAGTLMRGFEVVLATGRQNTEFCHAKSSFKKFQKTPLIR